MTRRRLLGLAALVAALLVATGAVVTTRLVANRPAAPVAGPTTAPPASPTPVPTTASPAPPPGAT
nr:hypothetical protein [Micromonospora provocatoris]